MYRKLGGIKGHCKSRRFFFCRKETKISSLEQDFFVHHRTVSTARRVEYVSDRMSYIILRRRRCNIIFVNKHEPSDNQRDDSKENFMRN